MGDIYCKCGEPWDADMIHEWIEDEHYGVEPKPWQFWDGKRWRTDQEKYEPIYNAARARFRKEGCTMFGTRHSDCNPRAGEIQALADELMGDDVDGVISMMEDAEQMGLF